MSAITLEGFARKPYDLRVMVRIFPLLPSTRPLESRVAT